VGLDNKIFSIRIPSACQHNTKLKIPGEGLNAFQHDIKGNLLVQILINIPNNLTDYQKSLLIELQNTR
jgi:DnaJ-class molecular chaperone